ncbi:MAG: hypothetical protein RLZZ65_720 [Bacteroidota bacterium]|jgi:hypothetical protein
MMQKLLRSVFFICLLLINQTITAQGLTCSTAQLVAPGSFLATTLSGTPSTPGLNGNGLTLTAGWYRYTPTISGTLTIQSCGGGADTRLWVWTGTCSNLSPVANNDDFPGCFSSGASAYASKIENITVLAGNTYYFEWDNQWEASGFSWSFNFTPLPINNDSGISYLSNRYQRIPISQATAGIPLGGTIQNYSGGNLTNVVLTAAIFEVTDTLNPVATLSSAPINLASGHSANVNCGSWNSAYTSSKSFVIKYTKTQAQTDANSANDVATQALILDYNYYARDDNNFQTAYNWSSTNFSWKQGNVFNFLGAGSVTGVSYYLASNSTTQTYTVQVFTVLNGIPSANPIYTSQVLTANGAGWKTLTFNTPLVISTGAHYLFAISHSGTSGFPLGVSNATATSGKSLVKVGNNGWNSTETYGLNAVFMMRPKFGQDPTNDIAFLDNLNPGGAYTQQTTRQTPSGNTLSFWARATNLGAASVNNVTLTVQVKNENNTVLYSATSTPKNLIAGQIDTFTVADFNVSALGAYSVSYIFDNPGDQIPQNNTKTTFFTRTTGQMSRTVGNNGSQGINATTMASNIVLGNTYTLAQTDVIDSVLIVLNAGTPAGYLASVKIYQTTDNGSGTMIPNSSPIATTLNYTTTAADHLNGVVVKLPIAGGALNLTPGTYFFGVSQATSAIGNIRLATSTDYYAPNSVFFKWDQANSGAWQNPSSINYSFVINPIFKSCIPINISSNISAATCAIADGAAVLNCTGGTGQLSILWSNGNTGVNLNGVAAGPYPVIVSDANNCQQSQTIFIPNSSNLTVNATTQQISCSGQSNGSIALNVSQGTAPYSYNWANNLGSNTALQNLAAGSYSCVVTDAAGCQAWFTATLTELHELSVHTLGNLVLCNENQTGVAQIEITTGTAPYTYNWLGQNNNTNIISTTGPANFSCMVTDATGCAVTQNVNFTLSNLSSNLSVGNINCPHDPSGSLTLSTSGGSAPYHYQWAGIEIDTAALTGLAAGAYACIIADANGCQVSATATISEPTMWSVQQIITPEILGNDGAIELVVEGANAPYSFGWSNNANTQNISSLAAGNYFFQITDALGCHFSDTITVQSIVGTTVQELTETLVYPNPSRGNFYIVGPAVEQIFMFNQMGQALAIEVQTLGNGAIEVITNNVATGSYILELRSAQEITRKALQIIK